MAYRKLSDLSILAERVFECYGWGAAREIDLIRSSRCVRSERMASDYGGQYFVYRQNDGVI